MQTTFPPSSQSTRRVFLQRSLGVLGLPLLAGANGCASDSMPTASTATAHRLTARPGTPIHTPRLGGWYPLGMGGQRDGYVCVPEGYDPAIPAPLLVILHGAGGSAITAWEPYAWFANEYDVVVLAPDSRGRTWDLVAGRYGPDVAFLNEAMGYVFDRCVIDPARIALGGFSDGASYILSLGVSNGDLFSHLVAFSPGFYVAMEPLVGQPRVFVAHGTQDAILPLTRSRDTIVPAFQGAGYDVTYEEFEGPHTVTWDISVAAFEWFLEREPVDADGTAIDGPGAGR